MIYYDILGIFHDLSWSFHQFFKNTLGQLDSLLADVALQLHDTAVVRVLDAGERPAMALVFNGFKLPSVYLT